MDWRVETVSKQLLGQAGGVLIELRISYPVPSGEEKSEIVAFFEACVRAVEELAQRLLPGEEGRYQALLARIEEQKRQRLSGMEEGARQRYLRKAAAKVQPVLTLRLDCTLLQVGEVLSVCFDEIGERGGQRLFCRTAGVNVHRTSGRLLGTRELDVQASEREAEQEKAEGVYLTRDRGGRIGAIGYRNRESGPQRWQRGIFRGILPPKGWEKPRWKK